MSALRPHRLTPVQKQVLRWLRDSTGQGPVRMLTGHKTTRLLEGDSSCSDLILCQTTVQYFLRHHGYIEPLEGQGWRLTEKGRAAAAPLT